MNSLRFSRSLVLRLAFLHIAIIALANYLVQFPVTVLGQITTWGMFVFPLVVLATDLTVRLSGQTTARWIVGVAYIPAILVSAWLADWRIGLASGTAYFIAQLLDIFVFQKIRARVKAWWVAPAISTFFANIVDTYVFFAGAFYRSADAFMSANWVSIATADLVFKIVVSILLFLPAYGVLLRFIQTRYADVSTA
ncbi:MAG: queuosine precursor transporter [Pseudomonadota bacterium]